MAAYVVGPESQERRWRILFSETPDGPPEVDMSLTEPVDVAPALGTRMNFEGRALWFESSPFRLGLIDGKLLGTVVE